MVIEPLKLIFLCAAGFFAAFVDSIAGGGGLISVPAYILAGFPPHFALGTNKFSATCGSLLSSLEFFKNGKIMMKFIKYIAPFTFIGAIAGTKSVLLMNQDILYPLVSVLILFVGVYTIVKKDLGLVHSFKLESRKQIVVGIFIAFVMGFYDGFFGPGTGSFLIFLLIRFFGMDFVNAAGNGKILNFVSNVTSLIVFAMNGKILYQYGIPVGICMMAGAVFGTRVAIKKGASFIKPIFIVMSFAVLVKLILQMAGI